MKLNWLLDKDACFFARTITATSVLLASKVVCN
jgi:hypothetical protein